MKLKKKAKPAARKPTKSQCKSVIKAIDYFGGTDIMLAEAIGVSRELVNKWRRGEYPVSLRCALSIEKKTKGEVKARELLRITI